MTFKTAFSQTLANKEQRLAYEEAVEACREAYKIVLHVVGLYADCKEDRYCKNTITKLEAVIRRADEKEADHE